MYDKDIFFEKISKFSDSDKGLATLFGVSPGNINDWKRGRSKPNIDALVKIADATNTTTDYLLDREETKKEPTLLAYSGNERIDSIAKEILKTNLTEEDIKLIEFILDKYKK